MMQYENVPAVRIKGIEGEVRYDWQSKLQLATNVSFQEARDQNRYKTDGKPSATYNNRTQPAPGFSEVQKQAIFSTMWFCPKANYGWDAVISGCTGSS